MSLNGKLSVRPEDPVPLVRGVTGWPASGGAEASWSWDGAAWERREVMLGEGPGRCTRSEAQGGGGMRDGGSPWLEMVVGVTGVVVVGGW